MISFRLRSFASPDQRLRPARRPGQRPARRNRHHRRHLHDAGLPDPQRPVPVGQSGPAGRRRQSAAAGPEPAPGDQPERHRDRSAPRPPGPASEFGTRRFEPRPPPKPSEFQKFVEGATGRLLPMFGAPFFADAADTFNPVDNVPVSADYTVGPGDEVILRAWGSIDVDYRTTVDRNGLLNLPKIGSFNVAGVKASELERHLRAQIGRLYTNFNLSVALGQLRSVKVFVVGPAQRPGVYTLQSQSTLLSAVVAAGGPASNGSMRKITLRRDGKALSELDVYEFLVQGDKSRDLQLAAGDVIVFEPAGARVALTGAVDTPAIYELKSPQEPLRDLLRYAGGAPVLSNPNKVQLERIDPARPTAARFVEEFALDAAGQMKSLRDGDVLTLLAISPQFANAVTLRGHVAQPLRYPYKPGMKIRDLIPGSRGADLARFLSAQEPAGAGHRGRGDAADAPARARRRRRPARQPAQRARRPRRARLRTAATCAMAGRRSSMRARDPLGNARPAQRPLLRAAAQGGRIDANGNLQRDRGRLERDNDRAAAEPPAQGTDDAVRRAELGLRGDRAAEPERPDDAGHPVQPRQGDPAGRRDQQPRAAARRRRHDLQPEGRARAGLAPDAPGLARGRDQFARRLPADARRDPEKPARPRRRLHAAGLCLRARVQPRGDAPAPAREPAGRDRPSAGAVGGADRARRGEPARRRGRRGDQCGGQQCGDPGPARAPEPDRAERPDRARADTRDDVARFIARPAARKRRPHHACRRDPAS